MRYTIFYCTGDLTGVDIQKRAYFTTITNRQLSRTSCLFSFFNLAEIQPPTLFDPIPVYYDVQCNRPQLYLTVEYDDDNEEGGILQITV